MYKYKYETILKRVIECKECSTLVDIPYDESPDHTDGIFTYIRGIWYRCIGCSKVVSSEIFVDTVDDGVVYKTMRR